MHNNKQETPRFAEKIFSEDIPLQQRQVDAYEEDFVADEEMTDEYKLAPIGQLSSSQKIQIISPMNFSEAVVLRSKKYATPDLHISPLVPKHVAVV